MRVRTISRIMTPRGEIPPGEIVTIPDEVFERLQGKVEPLPPLPCVVCYWCRGKDFWESSSFPGHWICRRCHPPVPEAERA
jgi:hypothetical protein